MRAFASIAALSIATTACSPFASTKKAEAKVEEFHNLLDAGRFDAIMAASDEQLKSDGAAMMDLLNQVSQGLGKVKSSKLTGWKVNSDIASGSFVNLTYVTEFERGTAEEVFIFRSRDDALRLAGYQVSSRNAAKGEETT